MISGMAALVDPVASFRQETARAERQEENSHFKALEKIRGS
jgi:hypothetical protein